MSTTTNAAKPKRQADARVVRYRAAMRAAGQWSAASTAFDKAGERVVKAKAAFEAAVNQAESDEERAYLRSAAGVSPGIEPEDERAVLRRIAEGQG